MPVQIIITGDHVTDAIAELNQFNTALFSEPKPKKIKDVPLPEGKELAPSVDPEAEVAAHEAVEIQPKVTPKAKKLSRTEQEKAMKEMIEKGEKDERFTLLTKGRAAKVEKALEAAEDKSEDDDFDGMFDDDDEDDAAPEVTSEMIKVKMGELGKDADGAPIQENLLKIREILTKYIPEGEEIKRGNIPEDKIADVYAELEKLEG